MIHGQGQQQASFEDWARFLFRFRFGSWQYHTSDMDVSVTYNWFDLDSITSLPCLVLCHVISLWKVLMLRYLTAYPVFLKIIVSEVFDCFTVWFAVHGVEYAFGAHDFSTSGVFEVEPHQCPGFRFRKSILLGTTCLDPIQVRQFMELQSVNYNGDTYHLITKNCNHFCKDMCYKLTGNKIPKWVNRLARIGDASTFADSCTILALILTIDLWVLLRCFWGI
jgi:hypothetical protein